MKGQPLTPDLESKVEVLASQIKTYPKTKREEIMETARAINEAAAYGQKKKCRNILLERLGYLVKNYTNTNTIEGLSGNIIYLMDFNVEDIGKVVRRFPRALEYDPESIMQPRVDYLLSLGVEEEKIGKVITKHPKILEHSIEKMKKNVEYFELLGANEKQIKRMVTNLPKVLDLKIPNMQIRIDYLKSLGIKDQYMGKVISGLPAVLELSIANMQTKVDYLTSLGISKQDVADMITKSPQTLSYNVEANMKPSYEYLESKYGATTEDIINNPGLLCFSLEKRVKPRHEFVKVKEVVGKYKAGTILTRSDKRFCELMRCTEREYEDFKKEYFEKQAA